MTKPMFIGIAGRAGSGKDPAADVIRGFLPGPSVTIALATGLKNMLAAHYGLQAGSPEAYKLMYTSEGKKSLSPNPMKPGNTVRDDLIQLGDATRANYKDIWVDDCENRGNASGAEYVLVPDVRYKNELQKMDMVIWMGPDDAGEHPTEAELTSECTHEHLTFQQPTVDGRLRELREWCSDYFLDNSAYGLKNHTYYKRTGKWPDPPSGKCTIGQSPHVSEAMNKQMDTEEAQLKADLEPTEECFSDYEVTGNVKTYKPSDEIRGKTFDFITIDECAGFPGDEYVKFAQDAEKRISEHYLGIPKDVFGFKETAAHAWENDEFVQLKPSMYYFRTSGTGFRETYRVNQLVAEMNKYTSWDHPETAKDIQDAMDLIEERGEIYMENDGYYVWSPTKGQLYSRGTMTAIGALLKYKNVPWDIQIQTDPAISSGEEAVEVSS